MDIETYRRLLESCLADLIRRHAVVVTEEAQRHAELGREGRPDATLATALKMEINGVCIALRLLGDYGATCFDLDWANRDIRPKEAWNEALDASYCRPIKRY